MKIPFSLGCESMSMEKHRRDVAIHQGRIINYIGHRLAHIESDIFKGMEFHFLRKFVLELYLVESLQTYNINDYQN